jgi:hypothetical protein
MRAAPLGRAAFEFSLPGIEGRLRELREFNDAGPVVLVFLGVTHWWY